MNIPDRVEQGLKPSFYSIYFLFFWGVLGELWYLSGDSERLISKLLPRINVWVETLIREGLLSRLVLDTYERETERYGGPDFNRESRKIVFL